MFHEATPVTRSLYHLKSTWASATVDISDVILCGDHGALEIGDGLGGEGHGSAVLFAGFFETRQQGIGDDSRGGDVQHRGLGNAYHVQVAEAVSTHELHGVEVSFPVRETAAADHECMDLRKIDQSLMADGAVIHHFHIHLYERDGAVEQCF